MLTCAAQKVESELPEAIKISPNVAKQIMTRNPSARPQRSSILASGMYTAADMALETM